MAAPMDSQIMQTMIDQNRQMLSQQNELFTLFVNGNQSQLMQTINDNMSVQLNDKDDCYARAEKSANSPTPAQTAGLDNLIANVAEEEENDMDADELLLMFWPLWRNAEQVLTKLDQKSPLNVTETCNGQFSCPCLGRQGKDFSQKVRQTEQLWGMFCSQNQRQWMAVI